jgi:hypothetical protein
VITLTFLYIGREGCIKLGHTFLIYIPDLKAKIVHPIGRDVVLRVKMFKSDYYCHFFVRKIEIIILSIFLETKKKKGTIDYYFNRKLVQHAFDMFTPSCEV